MQTSLMQENIDIQQFRRSLRRDVSFQFSDFSLISDFFENKGNLYKIDQI